MAQAHISQPELPNLVTLLADRVKSSELAHSLYLWQNIIFSLFVVALISIVAYFGCRKKKSIPDRLQNGIEVIVGTLDEFVCGILGDKGRKYTPFIGTLFIYILSMNLMGLLPLMKSSTSSLSTTLALALCVFIFVQYTAFKELGSIGYLDHLLGKPRGGLALSIVFPLIMFFIHTLTELIRPVTLSLRLRSNIWGDDLLLAVLAGFGAKGIPLLVFSSILTIIASLVQAMVFCLLTTVYLALITTHDEGQHENVAKMV